MFLLQPQRVLYDDVIGWVRTSRRWVGGMGRTTTTEVEADLTTCDVLLGEKRIFE